jgi:uncharacterized protein (DUF1501 family)
MFGQGIGALDRAVIGIRLLGDTNQLIRQFGVPLVARNPAESVPESTLVKVTGISGATAGLHPAAPELRALFESRALALVMNVAAADPADTGLAFFPNGFSTAAWAASVGHVPSAGGGNLVTGFAGESGVALVAADGSGSPAGLPARLLAAGTGENFLARFPSTPLGRRLAQIASLLQASATTGVARPLLFCNLSFRSSQAEMWSELSSGMAALYRVTEELGIVQKVTTYTSSGSHRLVMGGSVLGGEIYGRNTTTLRDQFEAGIAEWSGVRASELPRYFPGLGGVPPAKPPFLV